MLIPNGVEFPLGLVHFVGGQGVGVFPRSAYGTLLEALGDAGMCVFTTVCIYWQLLTNLSEFLLGGIVLCYPLPPPLRPPLFVNPNRCQ